jgi:hypothetical protein
VTSWTARPREIAHLLNPAFCALLLRASAEQHMRTSGLGIPFPLTTLILPIVLHGPTREALPRRANAKHHTWVQANPSVLVGFGERAKALVRTTQEAYHYALRRELIGFAADARVIPIGNRPRVQDWNGTSEAEKCVEAAEFLGKWFSGKDTFAIFAQWGVKV